MVEKPPVMSLCALFLACGWIFAIPAVARAEIQFDTTRVDLGKIKAAGTLEQVFTFKVNGHGAEILDLAPSCGCVKPVLQKRVYQAGETGEIVFGIHATGQQPGPHDYHLNLAVRDPNPRTIRLSVVMDLHSDVTVTPSHVLIYTNGGRALQQTVTVRDARPRRLKIEELEASSKRIKPMLRPAKDDPAVQQVVLNIAADYPVGQTEEVIAVTTNDPEYPSFEIPVLVIRSARVRCLPDKLSIRASETAPVVERTLILSDREKQLIQVASATCDVPGVHLQWNEVAGQHARVQVRVEPDKLTAWTSASKRPEVKIRLSAPEAMDLVVPIFVE